MSARIVRLVRRLAAAALRWCYVREPRARLTPLHGGVVQYGRTGGPVATGPSLRPTTTPRSYIIPSVAKNGRACWYACGTVEQILDLLRLKDREETT